MRLAILVVSILLFQCAKRKASDPLIVWDSLKANEPSNHDFLKYVDRTKDDECDSFISLLNSYNLFHNSIKSPVIEQNEDFRIELADRKIRLTKKHLTLKNPFSTGKYPMSFSIFYKGKIIVLFEPGKFACYDLNFERDIRIENALNTMLFDSHWIIGSEFVARSGKKVYRWNGKSWADYKGTVPMGGRPKLYEDPSFIMYSDCHGEFGGTIYFYDKETNETYYTHATCPRSVLKQDSGYHILASSMTSFESIHIRDPRKLSNLKDTLKMARPRKIHENIGYHDSSNHAAPHFQFFFLEAFSSFKKADKTFYILKWHDFPFLAQIEGNVVKVVNPLFLDHRIYTHNPVTTTYTNDVILLNLDFYGLGNEREVSLLVLKDNELVKVDWNEEHFPWVKDYFKH